MVLVSLGVGTAGGEVGIEAQPQRTMIARDQANQC